jgi:hypothetical protein
MTAALTDLPPKLRTHKVMLSSSVLRYNQLAPHAVQLLAHSTKGRDHYANKHHTAENTMCCCCSAMHDSGTTDSHANSYYAHAVTNGSSYSMYVSHAPAMQGMPSANHSTHAPSRINVSYKNAGVANAG